MTIRIRLLGPLEVDKGGEPVALPARKTDALLAILALRPGVAYGRERLIAWLWPDVPENQGRTSLRQALGHLRKALTPESIVSSADKVYLEPSTVSVDVAEVERLLHLPPVEREPLGDAWQGELLEGFGGLEDAFDEWLALERTRLVERVAIGLEECLAALSAADQLDRALRVGARLLEIDPVRESAHRALMRIHLARGDRALALQQYERCVALLDRRFGLEPAAETEALRRAITELRDAPALGEAPVTSDAQPAPRAPAASPPSVRHADGRLRLAVLPFTPAPDTGNARLLAEALTEDVTIELSRFRPLAVVARPIVLELVARQLGSDDIARETGAQLLLSGTVRSAGERARVTASLADATTRLQLWAERWDIFEEELFAAVDRLARNVVAALALEIDEARLGQARRRSRERLEVYECWLRGLECLRRGTPQSDEEARGYFEQALALSPSFARAYAGISLSYFNDWSCQAWSRWHERERLAFEYARRAVELDPGDHVTHGILGRIYVYRREFALGERHLEQMLALNSNDADMLMHAALAFAQLGDADRACSLADRALSVNARAPAWYHACAAWPSFVARRPEEALARARCAADAFVDTPALLAAASAHNGASAAARDYAGKYLEQFRTKIAASDAFDAEEPVRWLLGVNPLRRPADTEYLLEGLARAGLPCP